MIEELLSAWYWWKKQFSCEDPQIERKNNRTENNKKSETNNQ